MISLPLCHRSRRRNDKQIEQVTPITATERGSAGSKGSVKDSARRVVVERSLLDPALPRSVL